MNPTRGIEALVIGHLAEAHAQAAAAFGAAERRIWLPEALDAATDALGRAARDYDPGRGRFGPFLGKYVRLALRSLLRTQSLQHLRRPRTERLFDAGADLPLADHLDDTIAELPAGQRDVLIRRFVYNQTFREIAAASGRSRQAKHQQYRRALETLRRRSFARKSTSEG